MNSVLDGTITKAMTGKMHGMKHVCKNDCLSILKVKFRVVFLERFSWHLQTKQIVKILEREKITGYGHSKPIHHFDLTMKTVSDQSHAEI